MFVLNSDVSIGSLRFSGVHEIRIRRSLHSIVESATIRLPAIARIVRKGIADVGQVVTAKQFTIGDPVTIKLGYDGNMQTEFKGFVAGFDNNTPLLIHCEGYSWVLRQTRLNRFEKSISVKQLLQNISSLLQGDHKISIDCDETNNLCNLELTDRSGFDAIRDILNISDGALRCFFVKPDVLWCGFLYSPYADGEDKLHQGSVEYRLGYNTHRENELKPRYEQYNPVQVKYSKKLSNGNIINAIAGPANSMSTYCRVLNHIQDATFLRNMATEKADQLNYNGYEGYVIGFLEPYSAPGYVASIRDDIYDERNGRYLIESTEVIFGVNGAKRIIELGPRLGQK